MARYRTGAFGEKILISDSKARGGSVKPARAFTGTATAPARKKRATAKLAAKGGIKKKTPTKTTRPPQPPPGIPRERFEEFKEPWRKSLPRRTGAFGEDLGAVTGGIPVGPPPGPGRGQMYQPVPVEERESGKWRNERLATQPIEPDPWIPSPGQPVPSPGQPDPWIPIEPTPGPGMRDSGDIPIEMRDSGDIPIDPPQPPPGIPRERFEEFKEPWRKSLPRRTGAFGEDLGAVTGGIPVGPPPGPGRGQMYSVVPVEERESGKWRNDGLATQPIEPDPGYPIEPHPGPDPGPIYDDPEPPIPPPDVPQHLPPRWPPPIGSVEFTEPWQKSLPTRTGAFGETLAPVQGYRRNRSWQGWEDVPVEQRESGKWRNEPLQPGLPIEPGPPLPPYPKPEPRPPQPRPEPQPRPPQPRPDPLPTPPQPRPTPGLPPRPPDLMPSPISPPRERPQALSGSARFDLPETPQERPVKTPTLGTAASEKRSGQRVGQVGAAPSVGRPQRGAVGPRRGPQALRPRASGLTRGGQNTVSTLRKLLADLEEEERSNMW